MRLLSQFMGILCSNQDHPECLLAFEILAVGKITIPAKSTFAKIAAANIVPHSYAPNIENNEQLQQEFENYQQQQERVVLNETTLETISTPPVLTPEKEKLLFSKIDLDSAKE